MIDATVVPAVVEVKDSATARILVSQSKNILMCTKLFTSTRAFLHQKSPIGETFFFITLLIRSKMSEVFAVWFRLSAIAS
jgi:hypothetical protein